MHNKIPAGKKVPPFRPIISSIGTYNYALAKFLSKMLSPHIPTKHCAMDSFTFANDVGKLDIKGKFLISFDITSLFTQKLELYEVEWVSIVDYGTQMWINISNGGKFKIMRSP